MTSFAQPLIVRAKRLGEAATNFVAGAVVMVPARITFSQYAAVTAGTTTIPLFVAPAGHRAFNSYMDIVTPHAPVSGVNITLQIGGVAAAQLMPATSVETIRRVEGAPTTSAAMSAIAVPFSVDTTIKAVISVSGNAAPTAGDFRFYIELAADTSLVA